MNILLYVPSLNKTSGGVYQYAIALIKSFLLDKGNSYYIFNFSADESIKEIADSSKQIFLIPAKECMDTTFSYKINRGKQEINSLHKKLGIYFRFKPAFAVDRVIKQYKIDIIHCVDEYIPETSTPTICTLHDLQELHFPEYFTSQQRIDRAIRKKNAIENSGAIACSYQHVKRDIEKFFNINSNKISVCLLNMDNLWFKKFQKSDIIKIPNIPENFILYPAVTWPHKNHEGLIKALAFLKEKYNIKVNLVVTGHQSEYYFKVLLPLITSLNLGDQMFFLGVVEDKVLYSLYQKTLGVVVPTLYEAGSFPLMESMMMEVPVICSNVTSLPETIGNEKFIFDPKNIEEIAEQIKMLVSNEKFREENIVNSRVQNKTLQNKDAIEIIRKVYNAIHVNAD